MSDASPPIAFERLLAHREWVRTVARAIAFDAATADDLEQETWLEALRAPPRDDRNLRGWLGAVLRNRARKRGRSGARRARYEAEARPGTPPASPADLVAEAEAQQRVVAAVLALDEPYRTAVLLRFYEGLPPRDVAARTGVPVETARTRVKRAVARLRDALGGDDGTGLPAWMGAVAPLLGASAPSTSAAATAALGAVSVHTKKTILIAALAATLLGGTCALVLSLPSAPPVRPGGTTANAARAVVPVSEFAEEPERPERVHVVPPRRRTPEPVAVEEAPRTSAPEPPAITEPAPPVPPPVAQDTDADDTAAGEIEESERNAKIRAKYEEDRGGYAFVDLAYWVDAEKLEDSRWAKRDVAMPRHDRGLQLHARWTNEASAVEGMTIEVTCVKLPHRTVTAQPSPMRYAFDNLGKAVPCEDEEALAQAFWEDWKRGAKDVLEEECAAPERYRKARLKARPLRAVAVGTDAVTEKRERREWYVWADERQLATYVLEIRYGPGLWNVESLVLKGHDLLRNLREIKDKVRWD